MREVLEREFKVVELDGERVSDIFKRSHWLDHSVEMPGYEVPNGDVWSLE